MSRPSVSVLGAAVLAVAIAGAATAVVVRRDGAGHSSNWGTTTSPFPRQSLADAVRDTEGGLDSAWFVNVRLEPDTDSTGKVDPTLAPSLAFTMRVPGQKHGAAVPAQWEAMAAEGAIAERMAGDAPKLQDVIGNMTTTLVLPDGTTDDVGGGAGFVESGERFVAEVSHASDADIEQSVTGTLTAWGLSPTEVRVLHPLGPAIYVVASTDDPEQTFADLDAIQGGLFGAAQAKKYEAGYLQINDARGTPLIRVGNAFRNGGGISWITPTLAAAAG